MQPENFLRIGPELGEGWPLHVHVPPYDLLFIQSLLHRRYVAKYYDERVCLSVCLCVPTLCRPTLTYIAARAWLGPGPHLTALLWRHV